MESGLLGEKGMKNTLSTRENVFLSTNSSDVPPVFGAQNLPENLCCQSNFPVETVLIRSSSVRIELQSSSDFCETVEPQELAADDRRG